MKNITVSVDDEIYRKARIAAAEADSSVSGLVREFLRAFVNTDRPGEEQKDFRADRVLAVVEKMRLRHPGFDSSNRMSREEAHSRATAG